MKNVEQFEWDDRYLLGYSKMDEIHREFVFVVNQLLIASDDQIGNALSCVKTHLENHFHQESEWMEKSDFPARDCHLDEHNNVMASVLEVEASVSQGNFRVARDLAFALINWFPNHADYMDSALATWIVKRSHGGAPLVKRKSVNM